LIAQAWDHLVVGGTLALESFHGISLREPEMTEGSRQALRALVDELRSVDSVRSWNDETWERVSTLIESMGGEKAGGSYVRLEDFARANGIGVQIVGEGIHSVVLLTKKRDENPFEHCQISSIAARGFHLDEGAKQLRIVRCAA
jgi:hypothetical protein